MTEPIVHWFINPKYFSGFLSKWRADNPPIPFLRRGVIGTENKMKDPNLRQGRSPDRDDDIMTLGYWLLVLIFTVAVIWIILMILK